MGRTYSSRRLGCALTAQGRGRLVKGRGKNQGINWSELEEVTKPGGCSFTPSPPGILLQLPFPTWGPQSTCPVALAPP